MTELGNRLKEAREARGYSLDDLQTITKIQKRYLQGIEEGDYSTMPGKFYVRAFIKQYAEAVGIEPEELFDHYKQDIPSSYNEELPEQLSRVKTRKTIPAGNSKVFDFLPQVLIGVFIIGALVLLYYFLQQNAGKESENQVTDENQTVKFEESEDLKEEPKKEEEAKADSEDVDKKEEKTEEKAEEQPTQELAVVTAQGNETTYELKNASKFEVKVATTGETWVNILNGKGFSFFQGMLKVGATDSQTFDLSKETEAVIVIGRSTETQVFVNGQQLTYSVPPTEQVRQDITIRYVPTTNE